MAKQKLEFRRIFDEPGERFTITPQRGFDYRQYALKSPCTVVEEDAVSLIETMALPEGAESRTIGLIDIRLPRVSLRDIEGVRSSHNNVPAWFASELLYRELSAGAEVLIGNGRMNLLFVPQPLVIYEEIVDGKWHIARAGNRTFEKFDRVVIG